MQASNKKLQDLAETLAIEFNKVADMNPSGLTDAWALFQARNDHGVFLTPAQALKVGKWARAAYELKKTVKGFKLTTHTVPICPKCGQRVYAPYYGCRGCV